MSRLRTTFATLVLLAGLSACGADGDGSSSADEPAAQSPSETSDADADADTDPGSTLALTADGSVAAKCAMPSAETLATFDTAFAGTVTAIEGGTATLSVDDWYAGEEVATVTVASPSEDLQDLLLAVDFEQGKSYLVSATDDRVTLCGFTAEAGPELQALYDEAYGQ